MVLGQTEEVAFLVLQLYFASAVGTFAVHKLAFRPKTFARRAVPTFVTAFVYVAAVQQLLVYFLHRGFVVVVGSADKLVVGDVQYLPQVDDLVVQLVHKLFGRYACRLRTLLHLLSVFVGACKVKHVVAVHALEACDCVATNCGVAMSDVEVAATVVDWGGDVKSFLVHCC